MPGRKPAKKAPAKKALAKKAPAKKKKTKKAKKAKKVDALPPAGADAQPAGASADMQTDGEGPQASGAAADDAVQRFPFASLPEAVHDRIAAVSPTSALPALLHARR